MKHMVSGHARTGIFPFPHGARGFSFFDDKKGGVSVWWLRSGVVGGCGATVRPWILTHVGVPSFVRISKVPHTCY